MTPRARHILIFLFAVSVLFGILFALNRARTGVRRSYKELISLESKVGLIRVEGAIENSEPIVDQFEDLRLDPSIAALVVRVNSPGGGVAAVQEIHQELLRFRDEGKPVIISMGGVAASGGYYLACGADKVFALPGTVTGSIGVIFEVPETQDLLKKIGVGLQVVKSGKFKDTGNFAQRMSPDERKVLQQLVDDTFEQFLGAVRKGRGMRSEELAKVSDGRIFTGRQALSLGLIDTLGTLNEAVEYAGAMAGIKGTPTVKEPSRKGRLNWRELFTQSLWPRHLFPALANASRPMLRYQLY